MSTNKQETTSAQGDSTSGIKATLKIVVLAIIFGFLSGILGFSLVGFGGFGFSPFGRLSISDVNGGDGRIVIEQPRNVVVEQDVQLQQIQNNLFPTLFNVYSNKKAAGVLATAFVPTDIVGQGFLLTADGWGVAANKALTDAKIKYTLVGYQEKKYDISSTIEDSATGIVFTKVKTSGLPVATLGDSSQVTAGQTLIVISQRKNIDFVHVKSFDYAIKTRQDLVQSSEALNKRIVLDKTFDESYNGSVVANFKGEIVGIISGGVAIPVNYFKTVFNQVLNGQKITRPVLGISYIDLAHTEGLIDIAQYGAYVYGTPARTSPAFDKLRDGDIIKKIDDAELNPSVSLAEVLNNYRPGKKIYLTVIREKKESVVEITLN